VDDDLFLPGLPVASIRAAYMAASGNEIGSGKFANPESSAALVANAFGLFLDRPATLPPLPGTSDCGWPAQSIALEATLRFPWSGGRHPCLDVLIATGGAVIGVESKRYESFRPKDEGEMSDAYWRPVWGAEMTGFERCRDGLRDGAKRFERLDVAQLVKHGFALRTAVHNVTQWVGKRPVLFYLFAEPENWSAGKGPVSPEVRLGHRAELTRFDEMVAGDEVSFRSCSYSELLAVWAKHPDRLVSAHAAAVAKRFLD
jgi:Restriction Endonuclease associating with ARP